MNFAIQKKENLFWIDVIRALAALGVVLIHVTADVITEYKVVSMPDWWAANFYDSLVRGCVSLFVMVSGALLLAPTQESLSDFFKKRASRILIPFLIWTILYLLWKKFLFEPDLGFFEGLRRAVGNRVHFHLWFFYALVGIYLVTPIFRLFVRQATKRDLIYFLALWFVASSLFPFLERFINLAWHVKVNFALKVEPVQGLIGYFVAGHFLRQHTTEKSARMAWGFWAASFLVCWVGTYWIAARLGHYDGLFYENVAPNVAIYVAAFFVIMKNLSAQLQKLPGGVQKIILMLSKASFGIYLVHPMIMEAVEKGRWGFTLAPWMTPPALMILATTFAVYLFSFILVRALQKIPYLRRIV